MQFIRFGLAILMVSVASGCLSNSSYGNIDISGSYIVSSQANAPMLGTGNVRVHVKARQHNGNPITNLNLLLGCDGCVIAQDALRTDPNGSLWATVGTDVVGQHAITATATLGSLRFNLQANAPVLFYPAIRPGSSAVMAGMRLNAQVLVPNDFGDPDIDYTGTVHFISTDPRATLPPDTSLAGSGGIYTWSGAVILRTPGQQTVRAVDTKSGSVFTIDTYEVVPSAPISLGIWGLDSVTVETGDKLSFAVAALDQSGNSTPGYVGTIKFSSTDPRAILPTSYSFVPGEGGSHVFADALTFGLVGRQTFQASGDNIAGTQVTVTVVNSAPTNFLVTGLPQALVAGDTDSVTVTALDAFNNVVSAYTGTVQFTSTDVKALLPANYTFTPQDGGIHRFDGISLRTSGLQSVSAVAINSNVIGSQTGILVAPASLASLRVITSPSIIKGISSQINVNGQDAFGNLVSTYVGTVQLATSTDSNALLPSPLIFDNTSGGRQSASVTFNTAGQQTLQAVDRNHPELKGTSGPFWVDTVRAVKSHMADSSCALLGTGTVKCWGNNGNGQLGLENNKVVGIDPNQMGPNLPMVALGTGRTARLLGLGGYHACAILDTNELKCWGNNNAGQLGLGDMGQRGSSAGQMGDALPAVALGPGRHAVDVQGSWYFTCALLDDATIKCWGSNESGELGLGDTFNRGTAPSQMGSQLSTVALGSGRSALALGVGGQFACALLDTHQIKCWGANNFGQLGLGDTNNRGDNPNEMGDSLPVVALGSGRQARSLATADSHVCALLDNNSVKCWGTGTYGVLGLQDMHARGVNPNEMGDALPAVSLGTNRYAVQLDAGATHTCAVLDNGSLKCWGFNQAGELGLGDTKTRGDRVGTMGDALPAVNLGSSQPVQSLALGLKRSCVVLQSGLTKCWGYNNHGALGLGDTISRGGSAAQMGDALVPVLLW